MKQIFYAAALATLCGLSVRADETVTLDKNPSIGDWTKNYVGKLGAGIIIGEPTGASLKYWLNHTVAIDGATGWSYNVDKNIGVFYLQGDVLLHNFDLIPVSQGRLPVYLGIGGLARFRNGNQGNQCGVRMPVGLSYMFNKVPIDVFVEAAPGIDFPPYVGGDITGGIGIRFWF